MKFLAITLIVHGPDPITGVQKSTHERFREVIDNALLAEELGFDGFGVGERHERPFISSSPTVVLSHVAALTRRVRLFTAVTTLSLLDPVRASEDYATLDHLSDGRLELIIGKGNGRRSASCSMSPRGPVGPQRRELRGVPAAVAATDKVTARPAVPPRAARRRGLAAPVPAADPGLARQRDQQGVGGSGRPLRRPAVLGERHQPDRPVRGAGRALPGAVGALRPRSGRVAVGAGTAGYFATPALAGGAGRVPAGLRGAAGVPASEWGCRRSFADLEDFVDRSSALIGSPEQVIDKVHRYHERFGHTVMHLHADAGGLTDHAAP